ncbi:probable serine/threonine-protein kinase DDB_G0277165 isoform X2 [Athalia rosae]|nr:probable serine/threonine-protein kinase DDB_G0277165 isoform X2 [Athalia rosae]
MHRRVGHSNYDGKIAGLYDMEETLGRGHFAVVKLARHVFTGEKVAVKVIDKTKLDEISRSHLFQEVRCMKLVQHPNVVRLYEVIDTQTKLYLILELGDGGDLYDYIMRHDSGLSEEVARTYFRQIVRAISYCHRLHVVHRDLKPENVVFFEKLGMVKLTDFGFSNRFCPGQKLETSCGSLAYSAPEILLGDSYDAPAVDVWSLGVILYMLVCGQAPFQEANDSETLTMIMDCKYSIPTHVSEGCKQLIARMLVRQPERRATLEEIASNPWLVAGSDADPAESLPLVSRQQVSEEHHNLIITKMVNGNIATKEEILDALDKNEYNHITATYFLLAERKLRAHRQEQLQKNGTEALNVPCSKQNNLVPNNVEADQNVLSNLNQSIRSMPRTAGDVPQNFRARKCSIVQEEDDEDDMSSCSGRDDHGSNSTQSSVSRRGSRSEGKLSHVLLEKLSQNPEKHSVHNNHLHTHTLLTHDPITISVCNKTNNLSDELEKLIKDSNKTGYKSAARLNATCDGVEKSSETAIKADLIDDNFRNNIENSELGVASEGWIKTPGNIDCRTKSVTDYLKSSHCNKWRMGSKHQTPSPPERIKCSLNETAPIATTTILTVSSTAPNPLHTTAVTEENDCLSPKYKSLPAPHNANLPELSFNEFLEDQGMTPIDGAKNRVVRRTSYEQRRSKFHKTRTASCSSSDASDDDSEGRKKRAHKLGTSGKPLPPRRDSHDDSSDSQDPGGNGGGCGGGGNASGQSRALSDNRDCTQSSSNPENSKTASGNNGTTGGKRCSINRATVFERRHRTGRRRSGETRLRESQSLNRITEVQEAEGPCHSHNSTVVVTQYTATSTPANVKQKAKGFGARLLHSWSLTSNTSTSSSSSSSNSSSSSSSTRKSTIIEERGNFKQYSKDDKVNSFEKSQCKNVVVLKVISTKGDKSVSSSDKGDGIKSPAKSQNCLTNKSQKDETDNRSVVNKGNCKNKKLHLLSRYFAIHKKLCIPLPSLFGKGRLYKAQSCGSITRDRVSVSSPKSVFLYGDNTWGEPQQQQWCQNNHRYRGSDGDINQNLDLAHLVNNVSKDCSAVPTACHIHFGDPSKCCSLC